MTIFTPLSYAADSSWTAPTTPKNIADYSNTIKIAGHAANTTAAQYLGGNLVTNRSGDISAKDIATTAQEQLDSVSTITQVGAFGTDINENPDPYYWNHFYNYWAAANNATQTSDTVKLISANPIVADTTAIYGEYDALLSDTAIGLPHSLGQKPDILLGIGSNNNKTYSDYLKNMLDYIDGSYNPKLVPYTCNDLNDSIDKMYSLSDAMDEVKAETGKTGRYGDTLPIAQNYEEYIKGLQLYAMSQIEAGEVEKKTVAIIDPSTLVNGKYQAYNSSMSKGTAASCRAAEYVENTTNNIINTKSISNTGTESAPQYLASVEDIISADYIFITVQAQINVTDEDFMQELMGTKYKSTDIPPIYSEDPNGAFVIRANSVENFVGVGAYLGFMYPEIINPVYTATYVYKNFYHTKDTAALNTLVQTALKNASLPKGHTASMTGYTDSYVDGKIKQGMSYYYANQSKYNSTKLAPTDRLSSSNYSNYNLYLKSVANAAVSTVSNKVYTGKAQKPSITVKLSGKTLTANKHYRLSYSNNVKTGKATIIITGKGNYNGTKKVTFKIIPKKQSKPTARSSKKAQLTVKWKKDSQATGYQVLLSTNKKFKKNKKTVNISKAKTVKKTVKKLKKGKKYYVKIRAYKTIDKKKVYGAWSSVRSVKVKK